jgi:hypothetical protein
MLQIRLTDSAGNNPIILEKADNKIYNKALSSADEGISFEYPKNDSKSAYLNPYDSASYTRLWEVWNTRTNKRLNFGPITTISDGPEAYQVDGDGRSALLNDYYTSIKTFYGRIDYIVEEMRYENVAVSPSSSVFIHNQDEDDADMNAVLGMWAYPSNTFLGEDRYYNISKYSKDFIIDEQTGYIPLGKIEPPRTFSTTSEYWTGAGPFDAVLIDFGAEYDISRLKLLFPWWGGPQRATNRTYDFKLVGYPEGSWKTIYNRGLGDPIEYLDSYYLLGGVSRIVTTPERPYEFYVGTTASGLGTQINSFNILGGYQSPPSIRYLKIEIQDVHAWFGTDNDAKAAHEGYPYQCEPSYRPGDDSYFGNKLGLMTYKNKNGVLKERKISDEVIKPSNDCNASVVELGAYKEIIPKNTIKPLALQRIDNNSMQIEYSHYPRGSEMTKITIDDKHYRKFEPGTFFRKFKISWTGADNTYYKFYKKDCDQCYPDGFSFGVVDDDNSLIYSSDNSSGTDINVKGKQYTKHIRTRGSNTSEVTWVDAWKGITDPMSWGGTYSYSEYQNDYFVVSFRGESLKWYATIPSDKTGSRVKIEIRHRLNSEYNRSSSSVDQLVEDIQWALDHSEPLPPIEIVDGNPLFWSDWTVLEADYQLPNNVSSSVVYEIPYNAGILESETSYQIKVTLLTDGYCSIDSFEGYWSASFTEYNEDSSRIVLSKPDVFKQIYNKKFTAGSMYKWNKPGAAASMQFEGDRIIIQSAKGRQHGKLTLILLTYEDGINEYDPGTENHVFIPTSKGGDPSDGSLTVNLSTGKRGQEFANFIIFDSNDIFSDEGGLPWGKYMMKIIYTPSEKYTASKTDNGSSSFQYRCRDCDGETDGKTTSIYRYVYLDAIGVHERVGVSVNFEQKPHLEIIKSMAEAIQVEWDAAESGLIFEPRLGIDKDIALRESENTLVSYQITNDLKKVATRLLAYGSSIDGLDLFTITEDKKTREAFGRTITRQNDFRDIASYSQLIGLSRMELKRRNKPERRITVTHRAEELDLERGDSFILWTKKSGNLRVRIEHISRKESSSSGTTFDMECVEWPQIS